uniref:Photosystem I 4 kDa hydrophobic subunit n=1 Tax=Phacus orbicularis TaxID=158829 RepID=A0A182B101_9EUGL|nr:photosystem I 4 kDa hydrophobic subunit [Phacus orbicularis]
MSASFLPSLLVPIIGLLFPLSTILYFLYFVNKKVVS